MSRVACFAARAAGVAVRRAVSPGDDNAPAAGAAL